MPNRSQGERDADGVTIAPGPNPARTRAWVLAAFALFALAMWLAFGARGSSGPPVAEREEAEVRPLASGDGSSASGGDPYAAGAGGEPQPGEPARGAAGESASGGGDDFDAPSGIDLFPPPGTDPIKIGIVVPEDFPLPEGYVRHYQVTDDGQPMPAILMFHPDYELRDDAGNLVPLPPDRMVPPELAPEGMPIERLVPPPPREEEGAP